MWTTLSCFAAISLVAGVEALQVFSLPVTKVELPPDAVRRIHKRHVSSPLLNKYPYFVVDITLGTPPQRLQAQLDTGSSDLVVLTSGSDFCTSNPDVCSASGTYNANSSSTYQYYASDLSIAYLSGEVATGDYANDTLTIGSVALKNFHFGIMYNATVISSILGVGFDVNEFASFLNPPRIYRNLPLALVDAGVIPTAAFSVYLNNIQDQAAGGSVIFGGIDTEKYCGPLARVPIIANSFLGIREYTINMQSVSATRNGEPVVFSAGAASLGPALLDTGASIMILPDALAGQIFDFVNVTVGPFDILGKTPCSNMNEDITFNFEFDTITINVDINQLVGIPDENNMCFFGIVAGSTFGDPEIVLLGDTFLSSAYTVFDVENKNIYLAQAKLNAVKENIVQINAGVNGVPQLNGGCDGNPATTTTTRSTTQSTTTTARSTTRSTTRTTTRTVTRTTTKNTSRTTARSTTSRRSTIKSPPKSTTTKKISTTKKTATSKKPITTAAPKCNRDNCYNALAREKAEGVKFCSKLKKGIKCSTPSRVAAACSKKPMLSSACSCLPTSLGYYG
ncbi:hypothetical protein TWF730_006210 [Orbilia blumenaviensis]|uniref:Peptidase A1 domain-containing protein n=1 Tax=Orbilia blumenaviensis TaxID=1796055 RepID=A0AAV9VG05_9PEZI